LPCRAVGIAMEIGQRATDRGERLRRGPERVLVRRDLDRVADAELALELLDRLPGRVRGERPDPFGDEQLHQPPVAAVAAGYEPRTFRRSALFSTSASAWRTRRSRRWPFTSRKKTYFH